MSFHNMDRHRRGLPAPEYEETPNTVKLILRNNIDERTAHRADKAPFIPADEGINEGINEGLSEDEKQLLACIRKQHKSGMRKKRAFLWQKSRE